MSPLLGVTLPQFTDDGEAFVEAALRCEAMGLDSIWVFDHLWPLSGKERPFLEAWTALAHVAAVTEKITIGTLVTRSTLRAPALVARMAQTVGRIAPGRMILGLGSGDELSRPENEAFGLPYFDGAARAEQLADVAIAVCSALAGHRVEPEGLPGWDTEERVPVWVGGRAQRTIEVAARYADGWNGWGKSIEQWSAAAAEVRRQAGNRPVALTWGGLAVLGADDSQADEKAGRRSRNEYIVGGPQRVAGHLRGLVDAGADHLIVTFPDAGRAGVYERLVEEVKPALVTD